MDTQEKTGGQTEQNLVGIRGWLILPAIGFIVGIILGIIVVIVDLTSLKTVMNSIRHRLKAGEFVQ